MTCFVSKDVVTVCFKESADAVETVKEETARPEKDPLLLCRQCRQAIARPADRIHVGGAHQHIFSNPHGLVYEIGCFHRVTGCAYAGDWSEEFTWFAGYSWRTLVCTGCLFHLGWAFGSSGGDHFFGLILDHLIRSL